VPADAVRVNLRKVSIPISWGPARDEDVKEVRLYASRDEGATWTLHAVAGRGQATFSFEAPADGLYWLTPVIVTTSGKMDPADLTRSQPAVRLWVDTTEADR
jgi:hypothetical protein